jgi:hypothetical protein
MMLWLVTASLIVAVLWGLARGWKDADPPPICTRASCDCVAGRPTTTRQRPAM